MKLPKHRLLSLLASTLWGLPKRVLSFPGIRRAATLAVWGLVLLAVPLFSLTRVGTHVPHAYAATSDNLNFQARLQTSTGAIAADGYYNVQFKIYDASTGGTLLWTETYYDSNGVTAGNDNRTRVSNGYLSVNLGSQTSFPSTMPWDQQLYVTMNIGGVTQTATPTWDGEMSPRLKLTAVPYAFNAKTAGSIVTSSGGLQSTLSIQTPTANQNFVIQDQGAAGTYNILTQNQINSGFIQNQSASTQTANFNIQSAGASTVGGVIKGAASQSADLLQLQDSTGNINGKFNSTGAQLTLGRIASSGTVTQGKIILADGTTDNYGVTVQSGTLTANRTLTLPDADGTLCTTATCASGGTGSYIQNQVASAQSAGFWINGAGTLGGLLTANAGMTVVGATSINATGTGATTIGNNSNAANAVNIAAGSTGGINLQANTTVSGNLTVSGTQFTNAGATVLTATTLSNFGANANIGTAAATVDKYTTFIISQTTAGITLSLPTPTSSTAGRLAYVVNSGSQPFTMHGVSIVNAKAQTYVFDGSNWTPTNIDGAGSGATFVGAVDAQTKSQTNGAVISGNGLYLQSADATNPGIVTYTGLQTFGGDKTFNGSVTLAKTGAPALTLSGAPAASGSSSLVQLGAGAISGGSASGTYLGANPTSFSGDFVNLQVNNVAMATISSAGNADFAGTLRAGTSDAFQVSAAGAVTAVGVNSGTGLLQGTGGLTLTGAANLNTTGTAATSIGNTTGTLQLTSNTFNLSTAGAITGATGITMASGNFLQNGTGTFGTGTGTVSLNGDTTIASGKNFSTAKGTDYSTTGSANNVALSGALIRLTGASAQTITGISAGTAASDGRRLTLVNTAAQAATLSNNSGSSSAGNQIITGTGADLTIPAGGSIELIYDWSGTAATSFWRVTSSVATSGGYANTALSNLSSTNINAALNATATDLTLQTTTSGNINIAPAGTINLNSNVSVAANKNITFAVGTGNFDQSSSTGYFYTGTGANNLNGNTTVATGKNFTVTSGTTSLTGTTNVNTTGSATTTIGNSGATNAIAGTTTVTGATNINTSGTANTAIGNGSTGTVTIGNGTTGAIAIQSGTSIGLTGATTVTGATTINTTGTATTSIGNTTGTLQLTSNTFNLSTAGAITGATGITMASGNFLQNGTGTFGTGTGTVSLNGDTTIASGKNFSTAKGTDYSTTGSANNVALSGALIRLTGASAQTITGISAGTAASDGRRLTLVNTAAQAATLSNNSGSSSAGNQIITGTGADLTIPAGGSIELIYDWSGTAATSFWRVTSSVATSGGYANTALSNLSSTNINAALNATAGNLTLQTTTSGNIVLNSAGTIELQDNTNVTGNLVATGSITAVGVNSGTGLLQGTGGLTLTGAANLNTTGSATTTIGNASATNAITGTNTITGNTSINTTGSGTTTIGSASAGAVAIQTGSTFGLTATGAISIATANAATSAAITIASGNSTSGTAATVSIDTGTSSTGTSQINIGTTNAGAVGIGRTTTTATINGSLTAGNAAGTGTFTNNGSTKNTSLALGDLAAGAIGTAANTVDKYTSFTIAPTASGRTYTIPAPTDAAAGRTIYISNIHASSTFTIGSTIFNAHSSATLVYDGSSWNFAGMDGGSNNYIQNQVASAQSAGFWINGAGTLGGLLTANAGLTAVGTINLNTTGSATTTIGNSGATNAIAGTTTVTGATTINGTGAAATSIGTGTGNTTIGNATGTVGVTGSTVTVAGVTSITGNTSINTTGTGTTTIGSTSGGAVGITANAASSFTTNTGALTLTSAAAATWGTNAGLLTLQGAGGVTVASAAGTTSSNVTIGTGNASAGASGAISIDTGTASTTTGTISIGTGNASAVYLGKSTTTTTINGSLTAGNAAGTGTFTNNGSTKNTSLALGDLAAGAIGTAANTVDKYTSFTIAPTASGRTYTIPAPTDAAAGRTIYISNIHASSTFTIGSTIFNAHSSATLVYDGSSWNFAGMDGGSNNYIQNQVASAQSAGFNVNGAGTIGGLLTASGGATVVGATSINASGAAATNINTGTSTGTVSIGNSAAGAISIQSGSGIGLTGAVSINTTGSATTTIGSASAGVIAAQSATSISLSAPTITLGGSSTNRLAVTAQISGASPLVFQGATNDSYTTTLAVTDPTANNIITLPNASGTVCLQNSVNCSFATKEVTGRTGLLIPLYYYPSSIYTDTLYNNLINLKKTYHDVPVTVIINITPPISTTDANYTAAIKRLHGAGITVLGYVDTNYTAVTQSTTQGVIDSWQTYYPQIDGIFLDRMTSTTSGGNVAYYNAITTYAHNKNLYPVIGNAGTAVASAYYDTPTTDQIVDYENSSYPSEATLKGDFAGGAADYSYKKNSVIVYGQSLDYTQLAMIRKYTGSLYITDDSGANPFDTLPTYLETLMRALTTDPEVTVDTLTASGGLYTGYAEITGVLADVPYGSGLVVSKTATSTTNSQYATNIGLQAAPTAASTAQYTAVNAFMNSGSSYLDSAGLIGVNANAEYYGSGTVGFIAGGQFQVNNDSTGTLDFAIGAGANINNKSTGLIGNAHALYVGSAVNTGGGTIANNYGIYLENQTAGVSADYGIYIQGADTAALYVASGLTSLNGGLTVQGAANVNTSGSAATNINTGTSTGAVTIGNASNSTALASRTVTFGTTGATNTIQGAAQTTTNTAGNQFTIKGSAGNGSGNGGTLLVSGGDAGGSGSSVRGLVALNPTAFSSIATQTLGSTGTLTQSWIDNYSTLPLVASTTGLTFTVPTPSIGGSTALGRIFYLSNAGTNDFNLILSGTSINLALKANSTATLIWNGNGWTAAGASSSTDLQSAYNNTLTSAGGAELVLNPAGGAADGLTIRNNATTPISGGLLEVQSSIGTNLFSVNGYGTELAANGGAETAGGSNTTFPANTWSAQGSSTVSRTITSGEYQTGQAGVKVVTTATASQGVKNQLTGSPVTGSVTYTVSFTAASSTAGQNTTPIEVLYSPNNGTTLLTCQGFGSGYTTSRSISNYTNYNWTKVTCTVTTDGTTVTTPLLIIRQTDAVARTMYIDNLSFIRNDTTTRPANVQIGGGITGGQVTLFTLDRSSSAPLVSGGDDRYLGSMYYDTTLGSLQCYEADGWGACGSAPDNIVTFTPEYAGAVLNGSGVGTMVSDFCGNGGGLSVNTSFCASGEARNYYKWTSPQPSGQSYSIYVAYKLPSTFKSFAAGTTSLTGLVDNTTNAGVSYSIFRKLSTGGLSSCSASKQVVGSGTGTINTWTSATPTTDPSGCPFVAGDTVVFQINVTSNSNAAAYVENLSFRYTNN